MLEHSISAAITLFILSMISERLVTWIKIRFGRAGSWLPGFTSANEDFTKPNVDPRKNKKREMKILGLNLTISFLIALAANANLFVIINSEPPNVLGWGNANYSEWYDYVNAFLGCILTGLFISLGSKFWHDTLDMLLQVKQYKEKLSDPRTYINPQSADQVQEYVNTSELQLAQMAYDAYEKEINKLEGVTVWPGYIFKEGRKTGCLEVHFNDDSLFKKVHDTYDVSLPETGQIVTVPVNKIVTGARKIHSDLSGAGMLIANKKNQSNKGSLGCVVKKTNDAKHHYLLSCYHVLADSFNLNTPVKSKEIYQYISTDDPDGKEIATFTEGVRTTNLDAALARLKENVDKNIYNNSIIGDPKIIREVSSRDILNSTKVSIYGAASNSISRGTVHNDSWRDFFLYNNDTEKWWFDDLLVLSRQSGTTYQSLSKSGDSGSLVLDEDNCAIGLVLGADDCFTYAIKMASIQKHFKIDLI